MTDLQSLFKKTMASLNGSSKNYPLVNVTSQIDGRTYKVRDMSDKAEAADLLANVRLKIVRLYSTLKEKFPNKPQIRQWVQNFTPDPNRFEEATPDAEHTSYSVNKGEKVHLCLRHREGQNESLVDENVMFFVSLHEMAHMITSSIGHGQDFWNNFGFLLREAEQQGFYKHQDFKSQPVTYCGVSITDAPSYDPQKDGEISKEGFQIGTITPTSR